jgi:hypothetical protein
MEGQMAVAGCGDPRYVVKCGACTALNIEVGGILFLAG